MLRAIIATRMIQITRRNFFEVIYEKYTIKRTISQRKGPFFPQHCFPFCFPWHFSGGYRIPWIPEFPHLSETRRAFEYCKRAESAGLCSSAEETSVGSWACGNPERRIPGKSSQRAGVVPKTWRRSGNYFAPGTISSAGQKTRNARLVESYNVV